MTIGYEKIYGTNGRELDAAELKAELFVEGVRIERAACQGVGEIYKEQVHGQFDFDQDFHHEQKLPMEFSLPDGTLITLKTSACSPYLIRQDSGRLCVEAHGEPITEIRLEPRPRFYDRRTSDGVLMHRIGQLADHNCVAVNCSPYCFLWKTDDQCYFCNLVPTNRTYHHDVQSAKTATQIAETTAAAFEEGVGKKFNVGSGSLPGRREVDVFVEIMEAVGEQLERAGCKSLANNVTPAAIGPEDVRRLKRAGYTQITMDLEVWDQNLFAGFCPGKAKTVGWQRWVESLEAAVEVFGRGNVRSFFVSGLEPKSSFLEGADYLASKGVLAWSIPWSPSPGSKLEGHRTPTPAWHLSLTEELVKIWQRHGYTLEHFCEWSGAFILLLYDVWARMEGRKLRAPGWSQPAAKPSVVTASSNPVCTERSMRPIL